MKVWAGYKRCGCCVYAGLPIEKNQPPRKLNIRLEHIDQVQLVLCGHA